jgi:hypothetical protein
MEIKSLGTRAIQAAAEAASKSNYEAAYHFLMAALHLADKLPDLPLVDLCSAAAEKYQREVDRMVPDHPLSAASAQRRGQTPLFETLQVHAKSVLVRHRA